VESKHSLYKSFVYAAEGLKAAVIKGRNFRIQIAMGTFAIILAALLKIRLDEWVALILIITFILILELVNTSIESIVDLVSPEIRGEAKVAKDVAAAAVLLASVTSIFLGALILLPKLLKLVQ